MVTTLLYKNSLMKIKKSFGRFFSLFLIVLVGVGFLAGIRESTPDIAAAMNRYMDESKLMDFEIVSTMGLTDGDVQALQSLNHVSAVLPSYSLDALDEGQAVRVQALEDSVNTVKLVEGRMPQSDTECVADDQHYQVGDTVSVTGDVSGKLKNTEFTVVGTVESALYQSKDYGNTTVGSGKLYSFIFIQRENFTLDAYTLLYVTASGIPQNGSFTQTYDDVTAELNEELTVLKPERENERYQTIYNDAQSTIQENQQTLDDEKAKGEKELSDAKAKLDENAAKLADAKKTLNKNEADLQKQVTAQNASFQSAKDQIADGFSQIDAALQAGGMTRGELDGKISELNAAISSLQQQQSGLSADSPEYAPLEAQIQQLSAQYQQLLQLQASIQNLTDQENQLNRGIDGFNTKIADAQEKIADGKAELAENQKKLDDGYTQFNQNLADFNAQITDGESKIQDAEEKLAEIETPKWTILNRSDVINGYHDLKSAMHTIDLLAAILPLFFILIVALMTSNTMARMIAEERGELGTLASLGFSDGGMISTYLLYVLTATVLGSAGGFFLGCTVIPKIIYSCFPYILPPLVLRYDPAAFLLILAVAAALMTAVTVVFCRRELKEKPAALMRPVPPKNGKSIFLERIGFVWKHLSFTWKVTMRNIFRYKQRVFMTIVGIAGCTALLLTGFGIKDSINGVAQKQYQEIFKYQDMLVLKEDTQQMGGDLNTFLADENIQNPLLLSQAAVTCESAEKTLDAYLVVPENEDVFSQYFSLKSTQTGAGVKLNDDGAVISQKIAEVYGIGKGDSITIKDSDGNTQTLPVSDVAENYIGNYIYISKTLYSGLFGNPASYQIVVSDFSGDETALAQNLIADGRIVNVSFTDDILRQAVTQNSSLNSVVLLLICIACLLEMIVLYNLTSISISERKREIATLKVLGFSDGETNEYIYREAFLLTLISIGVGLLLGIGLHHFIMGMIERDEVVYFKNIQGISFFWTFLITLAFSSAMQLATYFNLKKIDMIESLKSVE